MLSEEMQQIFLVMGQGRALWSADSGPSCGGPTLCWAVQLAVCARALCALRECSQPQPLHLAGFVPSSALGLELGLFPLLSWFLLACLGARSGTKGF